MPGSTLKAEIRGRIWDLLTGHGVVRFPGAFGKTPWFRGVRAALAQLRSLAPNAGANRVLVLSEPVLEEIRRAVVADGKTLLVPDLARTGGWLAEIDPQAFTSREDADAAARGGGSAKDSAKDSAKGSGVRFVHGREAQPVDLMIIGAVGVDPRGARIGKGVGEADLVYALGRGRGFVRAETPVAVIVHRLQILEAPGVREPTDLPVDLVVTPEGVQTVRAMHIRPKGLHPSMITPERLKAFPGLQGILDREGLRGTSPS